MRTRPLDGVSAASSFVHWGVRFFGLALSFFGFAIDVSAEPCIALEEAMTMHRAAQVHAGAGDRATKAHFREITDRYSTALSKCSSIDRAEATYLRGEVYLFLLRDPRRAIEDYEAVIALGGARRCEAAWNTIHAYTCLIEPDEPFPSSEPRFMPLAPPSPIALDQMNTKLLAATSRYLESCPVAEDVLWIEARVHQAHGSIAERDRSLCRIVEVSRIGVISWKAQKILKRSPTKCN